MLTPPRRRGVELLDEPGIAPDLRVRSLRDVARSNALFGGRRAVLAELAGVLPELGGAGTLLDVGTGLGDIPAGAAELARASDVRLVTIGLDLAEELAAAARGRATAVVRADAMRLPFADRSVDVVTCSQLLHHFMEPEGRALLRELHRVARRRVIVSDLRRSLVAAAGFWLASFPLGFHPVTRHDGALSVMRGFTPAELRGLVRDAVGVTPRVHARLGWRLTAAWPPDPTPLHRTTGLA